MPAATASPRTIGKPAPKRQGTRKRAAAKRSQAEAPVQRGGELNAKVVQLATGMHIEPAARHIALEILRQATPEQRAEFCPAGLAGKQRKLFIENAVTSRESIELARQHRAMQDAINHAKKEESTMPRTATKSTATKPSTRSRKQAEQPKSARTEKRTEQASKPSVVTASSIAKDNGLDPVAFRKWLRSENLRDAERTAVFADKRKLSALIKRFVKAQVAAAK